MEKLPDIFSQFFLKEGVVHAIEQLAAMQPSPLDASKAAAVDKGKGRRSGGGGNRPRPARTRLPCDRGAEAEGARRERRAADCGRGSACRCAVRPLDERLQRFA